MTSQTKFTQEETIPSEKIKGKYEGLIGEMFDVLLNEFEKNEKTKNEALKLAERTVLTISNYFGGRSFYLPSGSVLKRQIRDNQIFKEFKGNNMDEISRKYNLSAPHIYSILRKQQELRKTKQ
ncbi:Mor transcription activator family protein [Aggregatibacter actinomycetemcomitans]|uniref:Mor transcription activator family protein n=1 Tax=Aggregatibacter actinomycetemcomitans TaxID=714 RepID=UPI00023FEEC1|nr:Mor transcription activator family protein [Aggregatibacter actinomycetemcomitans]EHK90955.1 positive regulator of late transcription [Aggregatibacter actinomycetemcomitans RhAA1]KNE77993.1 positive regulator of late transcription [Aggregatibacter actinomycetemcomitans RhAA1]MBN6080105.1 positive regulator of late transcription [Aggregatibacter actinomycetemcomitans]